MFDVAIKGGEVVDGTGSLRRRADVGLRDGRVVAVGALDEPARRVVDASDRLVAPGFIDVHTHYDAQAFWDPTLSPSALHGVTTVVAGNTGFSIAPLRAEQADYLMRMLARVEGMPLASLEAGVPWDWTSTGEYLDRLDGTLSVNAGFMVGHSALRRCVMGEDAIGHRASDEQVAAMAELLTQGIEAGGLGFSTSRGGSHQDADGNPVPSRHAAPSELVALAGVCAGYPGTSLEFIPPGGQYTDEDRVLVTEMSLAANRPLNWNLMRPSAETLERDRHNLAVGTYAAERGGRVVALAMPVDIPLRFSFLTAFTLDGLPGWAKPMHLPVGERLALLSDPAARRELDRLARSDEYRWSFIDWSRKVIAETFSPETKRYEGRRVADIAAEEGKDPFDALLDIVCADALKTTFSPEVVEPSAEDWAARREIWPDPRVLLGASDAGAHLDFLATFNYTTVLLATSARGGGVLSVEDAVAALTSRPADLYGLAGRGRLVEGAVADVVVFDESSVGTEPLATRFDLPGGAGRLYAGAVGVERVMVGGEDVVVAGEYTDARPGRLLRSGRDTTTPSMAA